VSSRPPRSNATGADPAAWVEPFAVVAPAFSAGRRCGHVGCGDRRGRAGLSVSPELTVLGSSTTRPAHGSAVATKQERPAAPILPKGTDLSLYGKRHLIAVAAEPKVRLRRRSARRPQLRSSTSHGHRLPDRLLRRRHTPPIPFAGCRRGRSQAQYPHRTSRVVDYARRSLWCHLRIGFTTGQ
jgi:hypothetical protein